jgi:hypothetical protein
MTTAVDEWPAAARLVAVAAAGQLLAAPTPPPGTRPKNPKHPQRAKRSLSSYQAQKLARLPITQRPETETAKTIGQRRRIKHAATKR